MTVHLDISQLVLDPRRSGIQRAERELIRHWPGPEALVPCRFDVASGAMTGLPQELLAAVCEDAPPGGVAEELARIERYLDPGPVVRPSRLLSAELFVDPGRAAFYQTRPISCRAYWLVYDFQPWLRPEWFGLEWAARSMPYLWAMRTVPDLAFISEHTRAAYATRIVRKPTSGPVIAMGGDGLGLERQSFDAARSTFVVLGTIEPRKNALMAMQAVQALWQDGFDVRLSMVGNVAPDAAEEIAMLQAMSGDERFRHYQHLSDEGVRAVLRGARAVLFPSEGEGYGIPPMEALNAGIPVIIAATLPAIAGQPALGQIRLAPVSPASIGAAVARLIDDATAELLWQEAARMQVPTWSDFAGRVAEWVQA